MGKVPEGYRILERSERKSRQSARLVGPADPKETLTVTIGVRRRPDAPPLPDVLQLTEKPIREREYYARSKFAEEFGAAAEDLDRVAQFALSHGMEVIDSSTAKRTVTVCGTVEQMSRAFSVQLNQYETPFEKYRGREGHVCVPNALADTVVAVFGLDNRRMARRAGVSRPLPPPAAIPLTPPQVAQMYNFPDSVNAAGETIGLIEFGPSGYRPIDIQKFFVGLGLATPTVNFVSIDGEPNLPIDPLLGGATGEVVMDIDIAGAVAQEADIAVYMAPWTEQGWVDAISTAVHDQTNNPSTLSISWGWPELESADGLSFSQAAMDWISDCFQIAGLLGVTVFVSSGDDGVGFSLPNNQTPRVSYPASDPWVTGCGGTTIKMTIPSVLGQGGFVEGTWSDNLTRNEGGGTTGGGVSEVFPLPVWQDLANIPVNPANLAFRGRGVPDVAGNADSASGYTVIIDNRKFGPVAGTSAVAPLYAGLTALINASLRKRVGYLNPVLYSKSAKRALVDINDGKTNSVDNIPGYTCGPGWDGCTGLGRIDGKALVLALADWGIPIHHVAGA